MATSEAHGEFRPVEPPAGMAFEPDTFSVKPILAVPAVVIVTATICFVTTWLLFSNIFDPRIPDDPADAAALAAERAVPMNERFAKISSTDPRAEFQQPRLEGLQLTEIYDREGDKITAEMTTTKPLKDGNSPRYHADDLRADRIPELQAKDKGRVPIDQAIAELIAGGRLKARPGAPILDDINWNRPKESNGGSGKMPAAPAPPEKPKE